MADDDRFGLFKLEGERFEAAGVPVEALLELVTYRSLLVDVAKQCYLRDNPDRERSKRHLDRNFDLRLEGVDQGSSDLVIRRGVTAEVLKPVVSATRDGTIFSDYYDESRDLVADAVHSVAAGNGLPINFPRKSIAKFRNFGRTLEPGSRLRLASPSGSHSASLDVNVREAFLALIADEAQAARQEVAGRLVELDTERGVFHLRTSDGDRIPCLYGFSGIAVPNELLADENGDGPLVTVEGEALVSSEGTIQRFTSVSAVRRVGLDDVLQKLDVISHLQDGWLDRTSHAVSDDVLRRARSALKDLDAVPEDFQPAPLPDGGLRFEWARGHVEYVLEFEADGGLYMCRLAESADQDEDRNLSAFESGAFRRFVTDGQLD